MKVRNLMAHLSELDPDVDVLVGKNALLNTMSVIDQVEHGYCCIYEDEIDFVTDVEVRKNKQINLDGFTRTICIWPD